MMHSKKFELNIVITVKVGNNQEMVQSEIPTPKTEVGKTKLKVRSLY